MNDHERERSDQQVQTTCLLILAVVATGFALTALRPVLVPFLLGLFFVYSLAPAIDWQMRRLRFPRGLAIATTVLLAVVLLVGVGIMVRNFVVGLAGSLEEYEGDFQQLLIQVRDLAHLEDLSPASDGAWLRLPPALAHQVLSSLISTSVDLAGSAGMVLIFMLFIWFGGRPLPTHRNLLITEIEAKAKRYILEMVLFSALTGLLVGVTLAVLGVPFALMFGFLAFLLNFIPSLGSITATVLPLPIVLMSPGLSPVERVLALAIPAAVQFLIGNVIQPRVQSHSQNLHPVITMMALIFFGTIWGLVGAVLAVPLTGVAKIILDRVPATRAIGAVLAGDFDALDGTPSVKDEPLPSPEPPH
jgi:AI-2 transport protein TqsA